MQLRLTAFGRELFVAWSKLDDEVGAEPPHVEDHTGYTLGFVPPPDAPAFVDLPDRDL